MRDPYDPDPTASEPPECGCCGAPCPVFGVWHRKEDVWIHYLCPVCHTQTGSGAGTIGEADRLWLWDGSSWQRFVGRRAVLVTSMAASSPEDDFYDPFIAASWKAEPRPELLGPGPPRCRYFPVRGTRCCRNSLEPDLRDTRAWHDLVRTLRDADLLGLSPVLAADRDGAGAEPSSRHLQIESSLSDWWDGHPVEVIVSYEGSSGALLTVDAFTFEPQFPPRHPEAVSFLHAWLSSCPDPVRESVALAAAVAGSWRHSVEALVEARLWLTVGLLSPDLRPRAVPLALQREVLTAEDLLACLADETGDESLRLPGAEGSPSDSLDRGLRPIWDIWFDGDSAA